MHKSLCSAVLQTDYYSTCNTGIPTHSKISSCELLGAKTASKRKDRSVARRISRLPSAESRNDFELSLNGQLSRNERARTSLALEADNTGAISSVLSSSTVMTEFSKKSAAARCARLLSAAVEDSWSDVKFWRVGRTRTQQCTRFCPLLAWKMFRRRPEGVGGSVMLR